jgi:hypothetical protein
MNKKGYTFQQVEKQRKDNSDPYNIYNFFSKPKKLLIFILFLTIIILCYAINKYSNSVDINSQEYLEELKGESANSIWLNKLEGNFSARHAQRKELEARVKNLVLESSKKSTFKSDTNRPLILYAYSETPSSRVNGLFFLKHGLHASADFIFILNGETDFELLIPQDVPNIKIIKRENTCYDLGAYGQVLRSNNSELVRKYKRFILLNSSIRGPFLPTWSKDCWSNLYLDRLSDKIKLVGMSYNCLPGTHVQSMIFATDTIGIEILLKGDPTDTSNTTDMIWANEAGNPESLLGLSSCYTERFKAISAEISLTNLIHRAKYNVSVLQKAASSYPSFYENCSNGRDTDWRWVTPYETIFVKANRDMNIDPTLVRKLTLLHFKSNYTSWEVC